MSIEEKFLAAVDVVSSIPYDGTFEPSDQIMLKFYAHQMQATKGPCCETKPYIWNTVARNKWNAWNELGEMQSQIAMEKYIDELTKVIETMSYSEKIARFLSLMGSFYEVVPSNECEHSSGNSNSRLSDDMIPSVLKNYESPTMSDLYHIARRQTDNSLEQEVEEIMSHLVNESSYSTLRAGTFQTSRTGPRRRFSHSSLSSSCSSSSHSSNFDHLSDLSDYESNLETEGVHSVQNRQITKVSQCPTPKDILILTFINLQNSMEDILKKMDSLTALASNESQEKGFIDSEPELESDFGMNWTGTAFALLWPVVVEVILG